MEFHGRLGGTKPCPGKKRQAEIDRGGIERVHGMVEIEPQVLFGIQETGQLDQGLSEVGINSPISLFVGLGQGAPGNRGANPHMIEFGLVSTKTGFDIAKGFATCQLGEGHAEILIQTRESFDFVIAVVALHALMKIVMRQEIHELRKDRSSSVHWLLLVWA